MLEEEEGEQEIENLFEKIMKVNFPNLANEIDFQEVQETQRVSKKLESRKHTPRHIIITLPKMKEKERILKAAREQERVPITLSADFSKEILQARRGWNIPSHERQGLKARLLYPAKLSFRMERADKVLPR